MLDRTSEIDPGSVDTAKWLNDTEWRQVDRRLREYSRHRSALDAAEAFDLLRAEQLKIYVCFGAVTMYEYMEHVLGYGPHAARERMRVARALSTLPLTTAALARGERTYSAVRELTRVATAETEAQWLAATQGMVTNQIESLVAHHRPGDGPDDPTVPDLRTRCVRVELPPEVYALWRQARMVIAEERGTEITARTSTRARNCARPSGVRRRISSQGHVRAPRFRCARDPPAGLLVARAAQARARGRRATSSTRTNRSAPACAAASRTGHRGDHRLRPRSHHRRGRALNRA
jgi:hypothetical protein